MDMMRQPTTYDGPWDAINLWVATYRKVPSRVVLEFGVDAVSGSLRVSVQAARSIR
jgi:hypothetical protein